MNDLGKLPQEQGISAMRAINAVILSPGFFAVFFGTMIVRIKALVSAFVNWDTMAARYLMAEGLCYLIGVLLLTAIFNALLNDVLEKSSLQARESPISERFTFRAGQHGTMYEP